MTISEPGLYDIPADDYHADPCVTPSLSNSIAKLVITRSPAHAKLAHPKLTLDIEREEKADLDIGTAIHAFLTKEDRAFAVLDVENFRTKAAQQARDDARAAGKIPLKTSDWEMVRNAAASVRPQLNASDDLPQCFTPDWGTYEQTIVWREDNGILCRARLDGLSANRKWIVDPKTTEKADERSCENRIKDNHYDIQEAFYRRGIRKLFGFNPEFRFIFIEKKPPYAIQIVALTPEKQQIAEMKVERAIDMWGWCLKNNRWPGYGKQTHYVAAKPWEVQEAESLALKRENEKSQNRQFHQDMIEWQAPQV